MAKLGFILIVLLFGALTFAAGLLAPETLRQTAASALARLKATPPSEEKAPGKPAETKSQPVEEKPPIPYESLLIPTPLPADGKYALQLALLTDAAAAGDLAKRAAQFNFPARELTVVDGNGTKWIAVLAGAYASPDEARSARGALSQRLALTRPLPVVRLPPEKKKK